MLQIGLPSFFQCQPRTAADVALLLGIAPATSGQLSFRTAPGRDDLPSSGAAELATPASEDAENCARSVAG